MPSPDAHEAKRLFLEALERPLPERGAFLERACGGDASLRTLVESLLVAAEEGRGLLARPPAARAQPATLALERLIRLYELRETLAPGRGDLERAEAWRVNLAGPGEAGG